MCMRQETVKGADILIFCTPHQFTRSICMQLRGKIEPGAIAISLTKVRPPMLQKKMRAFLFWAQHIRQLHASPSP